MSQLFLYLFMDGSMCLRPSLGDPPWRVGNTRSRTFVPDQSTLPGTRIDSLHWWGGV